MIYYSKLPTRVRVLVLGGGIHGVGVLHDIASRGWRDCHLVEKRSIGSGTSSCSTKLIHGGLRYLKRVSEFGLVSEALHERKLLFELAPDIVKPTEFYFPILSAGGTPWWMVKIGLTLYDFLAGKNQINPHRRVSDTEFKRNASIFNSECFKSVFGYWDGQTDDLALVHRVAASAAMLGAHITEEIEVVAIRPNADGWVVTLLDAAGKYHEISALYVINCLGPWANTFLQKNAIKPTHEAVNNKGIHLILPDKGLKAGLMLQSPQDKRIFFVLPWKDKTLIGTTESLYQGPPDQIPISQEEIDYLLQKCNVYLKEPLKESEIENCFAGLRWLAVEADENISTTSREFVVGEILNERGALYTVYGGKLTSYRSLAQEIGDKLTQHFGEFRPTTTHSGQSWAMSQDTPPVPSLDERFAHFK